ncbi:MAG: lytic murein transglycosylase, partial [Magnetococcales bacterium]|nr:lytic murein transglycosylase [Magnetococcales bacterium]
MFSRNRDFTSLTRRQSFGWMLGAGLTLLAWPGESAAAKRILSRYPWLKPLLKHGYSQAELTRLIGGAKRYPKAIRAMNKQYEAMPYHRYRKIFLTEARRVMGREKMALHADLLTRITSKYGPPGRYLAALWGVESRYGEHMGVHPVLRVL